MYVSWVLGDKLRIVMSSIMRWRRGEIGLVSDELAEVGGGTGKNRTAEIAEPSLYLGVGEAGIGLLVELLDNLGGRVLGRAEAIHEARLVARDELAHGRHVRQRLRPRRSGHHQNSELAGPDVLE